MGCLVVFAPTTVLLALATAVFVDLFGMLVVSLCVLAEQPTKAFWNGIMTGCQRTVLAGGFVQGALGLVIRNTRISLLRSMGILIWLFFMALAVTTAFFVRTGITATFQLGINQF
jgi:hypothetical protein